MAPTKKSTAKSGDGHQDVDTLTTSAVADPHAVAFAERQRDPGRYDDPTVATPGVLDDIDEEAPEGPQSLVDPDSRSDLDISVDNRDQVQPMLDTLYADAQELVADQGALPTAAINAHDSDAVDVEALTAEREARGEERRETLAANREAVREATTDTAATAKK